MLKVSSIEAFAQKDIEIINRLNVFLDLIKNS